MNPQLILKIGACVLGFGLAGLAGVETPLDQFDLILAGAGTFLIGWAGFKRPGDSTSTKGQ